MCQIEGGGDIWDYEGPLDAISYYLYVMYGAVSA